MKKIILTSTLSVACCVGAFAQGSLASVNNLNTQITTSDGANAANGNASTWYTGNVTLEVFYASTASVTQAQINAINAANGVGGQLGLINADGFNLVSSPTLNGTTLGGVDGFINDGGFAFSGSGQIGLPGAPSDSTGWLVFYLSGSGTYAGYSGALAFANGTGGNPNGTPVGQAALINLDSVGSGQGINMVLSPVPEPTTMALAGLGGLSLFLLRRKK